MAAKYAQYFTMEKIPDYTMAKYSTQEGGNVDDVLKQHTSFYRQLHRRGLLFGESYTLLYQYDPARDPGKKLEIFFRVESNEEIMFMEPSIQSSGLSAGFEIKKYEIDTAKVPEYTSIAALVKKSGQIASSIPGNTNSFYVVDEWKPNEKGRLMALFRLMKALNRRCTYSIHLIPCDKTEKYREIFQKQMKWMKPVSMGLGTQYQKDDNADKTSKLYNDTIDHLRGNPHFFCEISAYADDQNTAKLIVDAAASEAVEEGNYSVYASSSEGATYQPLLPHSFYAPKGTGTPEGLEYWHTLFMLKEVVPLACFPTLYPGEVIEIPKETAPNYEKDGLLIGEDQQGYKVYIPLELLPKHAFLAGVPGSGKTYTMLHLASQISGKNYKIPILVLEPAKQEYRALVQNPEIHDLTVFAPGGNGSFPLRINPFEFPRGMKLSEHIVNLRQVFIGAFDLEPPMPFLLDQGIEKVYRACGWYPFEYNDFDENGRNLKPYPNMQMLYDEIEKLLDEVGYAEEVRNNLKSVLQVRIGSLVSRETGNVFNVPSSTFRPEEWMQHSCVLELESLGKDAANFLTLLLSTIIREYIKLNPKSEMSPRHVIFFEEAHNLIGPSTEENEKSGNAKTASTKFIVDMLAEVRALNEAIIIADQLPTALAPQVTKNTSLKIGLRITAQDDREMLASTMSANSVQLEQMALFTPGHALCMYEGVQKPFEVNIQTYAANAKSPDNDALYAMQSQNPTYQECMRRDMMIMLRRFETLKNKLLNECIKNQDSREKLNNLKKGLFSITDPKERETKLTRWKKDNENQIKSERKNFEKYLEAILELGEYTRMNQLMHEQLKLTLKEELSNLSEIITVCSKDKDYPADEIWNKFNIELSKMRDNLKSKR